jgi:hypothetical protein
VIRNIASGLYDKFAKEADKTMERMEEASAVEMVGKSSLGFFQTFLRSHLHQPPFQRGNKLF